MPERKPSLPYVLQTASGETIPVMKEAHVELTPGRCTLRTWELVADITDEFIPGLDMLQAYDASVDVERHMLRMGREEVTLWNPRAHPRSSQLTLLSDEVISVPCEKVVSTRPEAASIPVEPSLKDPKRDCT
jgi:hypothetical protein